MNLQNRSSIDRRSGNDRRKFPILKKLFTADPKRRIDSDRRKAPERRDGWVRTTKWSSMNLLELKISKFLKPY